MSVWKNYSSGFTHVMRINATQRKNNIKQQQPKTDKESG